MLPCAFWNKQEAEDKARLGWLRSAPRDGFEVIERQVATMFPSLDDQTDFINQTGEKLKAERKHG